MQGLADVNPVHTLSLCGMTCMRIKDYEWICKVVERAERGDISITSTSLLVTGDDDDSQSVSSISSVEDSEDSEEEPFRFMEYEFLPRPDKVSRIYGETYFSGANDQPEKTQLMLWLEPTYLKQTPQPSIMLTSYAHFVDINGAVPGVRVGSDMRVYQKFMPIAHRLAVMEMMVIAKGWMYVLVFVYGDEYGDEPNIADKMAVLRVPAELTGRPNEQYDDALEIDAEEVGWLHIGEENKFDVAVTFPSSHPFTIVDTIVYDIPDTSMEPDLAVVRRGAKVDVQRNSLAPIDFQYYIDLELLQILRSFINLYEPSNLITVTHWPVCGVLGTFPLRILYSGQSCLSASFKSLSFYLVRYQQFWFSLRLGQQHVKYVALVMYLSTPTANWEERSARKLIMGKETLAPRDNPDSPFSSSQFLLPSFRHDYIFNVEYSDSDLWRNMPGAFPGLDIDITTDMFPMCASWWKASVGPLLARSPAELIFVSTVKGDESTGTVTRVGLLRVSVMSVPKEYQNENLGEPTMGEIEAGDLSYWTSHHQPPIQECVRLAFPKSYTFPSAMMYDFKVLRPVACLPHLVPHILASSPPTSTTSEARRLLTTTTVHRPSSDRIRGHQTTSPIPRRADDRPSTTSFTSAPAASSIKENLTHPPSTNPNPTLHIRDAQLDPMSSSTQKFTSPYTPAREICPLPRRHGTTHPSTSSLQPPVETTASSPSTLEHHPTFHRQGMVHPVIMSGYDGRPGTSRGRTPSAAWFTSVNDANSGYMLIPHAK
ncbi:uncharacterized protein STEHIDRAFT_116795 [Stereum hirsutum FP-91666 SS1]|uniref:Uncharacterized protein n=1 Tax=Stereum hirsutum (strain FP-91666) TaxID=721885 RepID=R7RVL9_STEHR|nr:uncharacterized protein STEHIDRAFT_116795 [Stereum hirsutum FP-91666 SS1]EIM79114.1 hypothetical protein STEHIDRAFT_116795 [Stereum hirsutum FP-91666 SS1]